MKRKLLALFLVLTLLAAVLCACGENNGNEKQSEEPTASDTEKGTDTQKGTDTDEPAAPETQKIELGTSGFFVTVDASYKKGTINEEDTSEGQVAYYYSDDLTLDFDIYQWVLAEGETLESSAKAEAAEYQAEAAQKTYGEIGVYCYTAKEMSEEKEYDTATYMMENDGTIAEIVFWLDGDNAAEASEEIMKTLEKEAAQDEEAGKIQLGTSTLYIAPAKAYKAGEISAEDTDENQVGYFYSDDTTVDFDVYMWAKAEGETLEAAAAEEAAEFEAEVKEAEYNGIKVVYYNAVETSEEKEYNTVTYIAEDGDNFVEIVIWLDGETANDEAAQIIGSLSR